MSRYDKEANSNSKKSSEPSKRRFDRVNVNLPVAIHSSNSPVFLSKTLDVSEGGLLVENNKEHSFVVGQEVKVHIEGILSEGANRMMLHKMTIIRINPEVLALEFL